MNQKLINIILSIVVVVLSIFSGYLYIRVNNKTHLEPTVVKTTDTLSLQKVFSLPSKMNFCGEEIPLNDPEIYERAEIEWIAQQFRTATNFILIQRAKKYFPIIEPILKKNNIPDDFKYLAVAESNLSNVTSPAYAEGFWQFLNETGAAYGLEISKSIDERYDLEKSTQAACDYLNDAYFFFKNWTNAAASYNMGQGGLMDAIEEQKQNSFFKLKLNSETSKYIFRIITFKYLLSNPSSIGLDETSVKPIPSPEFTVVDVNQSIPDLIEWARQQGSDYRLIRFYNPWIRTNFVEVKGGKTYKIKIPKS